MQEFSKGGVLTQGTQGKGGGVQNICPDTNALIGKNKGGVQTPGTPTPPGSATESVFFSPISWRQLVCP